MPTTRPLTQEEADYYKSQGINPDDVTVELPDGSASTQEEKESKLSTVGKTLKAHAGGYIGGGAGALSGGAAGAELGALGGPFAPVTVPAGAILGATVGGLGGGYLGGKGQEAILGKEEQAKLEEEATQSAQENPKTALATDIGASAILSGGKPSLRNLSGVLRGEAPAITKVAMGGLVNPAINIGADYALTGQTPSASDIAGQVIGGSLFSEPNALGRKFGGHPTEEPTPEIASTDGSTQTDTTKTEVIPPTPQTSPYKTANTDGILLYDNKAVREAFGKLINPQPDTSNMDDSSRYIAQSKWRQSAKLPTDQMREALHQKFLSDSLAQDNAPKATDAPTDEPARTAATTSDIIKPLGQVESSIDTPISWQDKAKNIFDNATSEGRTKLVGKRADLSGMYFEQLTPQEKELVANNAGIQIIKPNTGQPTSEIEQIAKLQQEQAVKSQVAENKTPDTTLTDANKEQNIVNAPQEQPSDKEQYDALYGKMKEMIAGGTTHTPEFMDVWKQLEGLKNKNGGMPPTGQKNIQVNLGSGTLSDALSNHIISGANVESTLQQIASHNNEYQDLANHLLNIAKPSDLGKRVIANGTGRSHYDIANKQINLQDEHAGNIPIVIHEITHALTAGSIPLGAGNYRGEQLKSFLDTYIAHGDKNLPSSYEKANPHVQELMKSYIEAAKQMGISDKLFTDIGSKEGKAPYVRGLAGAPDEAHFKLPEHGYAMGSLDEFISGIMSNKKFQEKLNTLKSGLNDGKSLWSRIVEAIRNILGVPVKEGSLLERALKPTEALIKGEKGENAITDRNIEEGSRKQHSGIDEVRLSSETEHRNSPLKEQKGKEKEVVREGSHMGFLENITRSMIDKIRDISHPSSEKVADAFDRTLTEKDQRVGVTWNKIKGVMDKVGMTEQDSKQLQRISEYENLHDEKAPTSMFTNSRVRAIYNTERQVYDESGKFRIANKEPVYRGNNPTMLKQDPFAHPTTPNPKVVEIYKTNTDKGEIARLDKVFLDNSLKHGLTEQEAADNLRNFKTGVQGNIQKEGGNMQYYNAARRAQGTPLPAEFTRSDYAQNLEAYYHRQAVDNSFYKNVESNKDVMSALGQKRDSWNRPIPEDPSGGIAGHQAVKAQLGEFQGEVGSMSFHNERAISSLATTIFIANPALEVHKSATNILTTISAYADNPVQMGRIMGAMITNFREGYQHATENGIVKLTARSWSDMLKGDLTVAERMQSLANGIRKISSFGMLTDQWSTGLMQAGLEKSLSMKMSDPSPTDQQLFKRLDSSYTVGKQYDAAGISKLASSLAGYIHGTGDGRTLPAWMASDTEFSGFFKLAHWSISQTNRFMSDVYSPALKGDYKPLLNSLFGAAIGGYLIKELREKIQGKHGQIPSLDEIAASEGGLSEHKGLLAYNLIAATQYAGFGGLLSQAAKYPFDFVYKNNPQGATFPLDEIATDLATTLGQVSTAIANEPNVNWLSMVEHVAGHVLTTNFQLGRVAYNNAINDGLLTGSLAEKKELADKMGQLRRFNMMSGLPYEQQGAQSENPYKDLDLKRFKQTQDINEAASLLPKLVNNIMTEYAGKPDVIMAKLKAMKENSYETMPSLETMPLSAFKYLGYLQREEGPKAAQEYLMDYMKHKTINEAKASVVP